MKEKPLGKPKKKFEETFRAVTVIKDEFFANKITIVWADDWEGIYYNNDLLVEDHTVSLYNGLFALKDKNISTFELESFECNLEWIQDLGNLPTKLLDVRKNK